MSHCSRRPLQLATPVLLPLPQLNGYHGHRTQHGLIVFATNKGQITAVNARGQHVWQVGWGRHTTAVR